MPKFRLVKLYQWCREGGCIDKTWEVATRSRGGGDCAAKRRTLNGWMRLHTTWRGMLVTDISETSSWSKPHPHPCFNCCAEGQHYSHVGQGVIHQEGESEVIANLKLSTGVGNRRAIPGWRACNSSTFICWLLDFEGAGEEDYWAEIRLPKHQAWMRTDQLMANRLDYVVVCYWVVP